jgi:hypothetical protein
MKKVVGYVLGSLLVTAGITSAHRMMAILAGRQKTEETTGFRDE